MRFFPLTSTDQFTKLCFLFLPLGSDHLSIDSTSLRGQSLLCRIILFNSLIFSWEIRLSRSFSFESCCIFRIISLYLYTYYLCSFSSYLNCLSISSVLFWISTCSFLNLSTSFSSTFKSYSSFQPLSYINCFTSFFNDAISSLIIAVHSTHLSFASSSLVIFYSSFIFLSWSSLILSDWLLIAWVVSPILSSHFNSQLWFTSSCFNFLIALQSS